MQPKPRAPVEAPSIRKLSRRGSPLGPSRVTALVSGPRLVTDPRARPLAGRVLLESAWEAGSSSVWQQAPGGRALRGAGLAHPAWSGGRVGVLFRSQRLLALTEGIWGGVGACAPSGKPVFSARLFPVINSHMQVLESRLEKLYRALEIFGRLPRFGDEVTEAQRADALVRSHTAPTRGAGCIHPSHPLLGLLDQEESRGGEERVGREGCLSAPGPCRVSRVAPFLAAGLRRDPGHLNNNVDNVRIPLSDSQSLKPRVRLGHTRCL